MDCKTVWVEILDDAVEDLLGHCVQLYQMKLLVTSLSVTIVLALNLIEPILMTEHSCKVLGPGLQDVWVWLDVAIVNKEDNVEELINVHTDSHLILVLFLLFLSQFLWSLGELVSCHFLFTYVKRHLLGQRKLFEYLFSEFICKLVHICVEIWCMGNLVSSSGLHWLVLVNVHVSRDSLLHSVHDWAQQVSEVWVRVG